MLYPSLLCDIHFVTQLVKLLQLHVTCTWILVRKLIEMTVNRARLFWCAGIWPQPPPGFTDNGPKKRSCPVSSSSVWKYLVGVDVSSRRSKSDIISKQFFKHENHFTGFKSTKSGSNRAAVAVVEVDICIMMWRWHVCSNCVTLSCYHGENVSLLKLYYKEWSSSEGKRAPAHY